jgi:hypothetical protein
MTTITNLKQAEEAIAETFGEDFLYDLKKSVKQEGFIWK